MFHGQTFEFSAGTSLQTSSSFIQKSHVAIMHSPIKQNLLQGVSAPGEIIIIIVALWLDHHILALWALQRPQHGLTLPSPNEL